jgi:hypothetical protein
MRGHRWARCTEVREGQGTPWTWSLETFATATLGWAEAPLSEGQSPGWLGRRGRRGLEETPARRTPTVVGHTGTGEGWVIRVGTGSEGAPEGWD